MFKVEFQVSPTKSHDVNTEEAFPIFVGGFFKQLDKRGGKVLFHVQVTGEPTVEFVQPKGTPGQAVIVVPSVDVVGS
jgi:hypothetical protein